ncbi:MSMEG_0569 family flavin-dependent oxidoreductase [Azospirillum sp. YIM B02556]|uniref:MSMEG_0569 family flavin-dependent oxidoreductase n=1 Tax=Azospirillum endophyticum TaxID=2800326 RepID=A0ABS1FAR2_9PROT|nr:MSMEG_0569 family flavin-dependent oxidoreductase [Azospirillum endophyticum]MBK1840317.1 MSMEG_0569 family flavin-dependent oxidoreductase [Azospirillum endophyticum]
MTSVPHVPVVIVGGGQAGLSVSHNLKKQGVEHLVLEKNRIGHSWRNDRWDSFCLVTPNWQCRLPDYPYRGADPTGYMVKDEIVSYLEGFAEMVKPPIREGVAVTRLSRGTHGGFDLETSDGPMTADQVVVATGGYDIPIVPPYAHALSRDIVQMHSVDYRNPDQLPPGAVLVVGSGQSGVQIMEDLYIAGRQVHLCVGPAPRSPRRYRGKDATEWLMEMGYYQLTVDKHPLGDRAKEKTNHYMSGRAGGHEIDLRRFALQGVKLHGSMAGMDGTTVRFADDLAKNLDDADEVYVSIRRDIDAYIARAGLDAPEEPPFVPVWAPDAIPDVIDCAAEGISAIVWAIGFRPNYGWIELPAFDGRGNPKFRRGVSPVDGLYFIGLPWLNTWGSGRFLGVAEDSAYLAEVMRARIDARQPVAA